MKPGVESGGDRLAAAVRTVQDGRWFYPILALTSAACIFAIFDFGSPKSTLESREILPSLTLRLAGSPPPSATAPGASPVSPDDAARGQSDAAGAAESESELQKYLARVRAMVERQKRYPPREKNAGRQGLVTVQVDIDRSGTLQAAKLVGRSPHEGFNDAALRAVRGAAPFPEVPAKIAQDLVTFRIRLNFRL